MELFSYVFSSDDCKYIIVSYSNQVKLNYLQDLKGSGWCWSMWNNTSTKNRCAKENFERNKILLRLNISSHNKQNEKMIVLVLCWESTTRSTCTSTQYWFAVHTHTIDSPAQISFQISKIQNQHCSMTYRRDIFVM
jgi:hypothetical protein